MYVMLGVAPAGATANAGALDPSFGNGGQETIHFDGADAAWGMTEQPDGKPVLVGQSAPEAFLMFLLTIAIIPSHPLMRARHFDFHAWQDYPIIDIPFEALPPR